MSTDTLLMFLLGPIFPFWTGLAALILAVVGYFLLYRRNSERDLKIYCIYLLGLFAITTGSWLWRYESHWWPIVAAWVVLCGIFAFLILRYSPTKATATPIEPARYDIYFVDGGCALRQRLPKPALDIAYIKGVHNDDDYYIPEGDCWLMTTAEDSMRRVVGSGSNSPDQSGTEASQP